MYEIEVKSLPRQDAAVIRFKCPPGEVPQHLGPAYGEIGSYVHEAGIEHEDAGVYARFLTLGPEFEVEAGFTVHAPVQPRGRVQPGELPEGQVGTAVHIGPYSGLVAATTALREWIAANGREIRSGADPGSSTCPIPRRRRRPSYGQKLSTRSNHFKSLSHYQSPLIGERILQPQAGAVRADSLGATPAPGGASAPVRPRPRC
jgi:effector-binding domain-containing protein